MRIGVRITGLAILPILLTALVAASVALYQKQALQKFFALEIERHARSEAQKIAQDVYLMCRAAQEATQITINNNLRVAEFVLEQAGGATFSAPRVTWEAVDQYTHQHMPVDLPRMLVGDQWLGQVDSFEQGAPIVDQVRDLVGGTATIFQRMNPQGDMLRVATNVADAQGRRAIGTYLPARFPDGGADPVVAALLKGETFHGRAFVVNAWYVTAYQPIRNTAGTEVVGALYVGVKQESLESLRRGIMDIIVGKTGYVYVLGGTGEQRGTYIISQDGRRDGENLWDEVDAEGHPFIREIVEKALSLPKPSRSPRIPVEFVRYPWRNPGEAKARHKVVAIAYFDPWDWVIGAGYYETDLRDSQFRLQAAMNQMGYWTGLTAVLMMLLAVPAGYFVAGGIRNRIDSILTSVEEVLIVTDPHGRIVLLSKPAEELLGASLHELIHRPLEHVISHPQLRNCMVKALEQAHGGTRFDVEVQDGGATRIMEGRTSLIQTRVGTAVGMIFILHDVTGERAMDRMKSEFICTAAHELSTPLSSIIGYSELLLNEKDLPAQTGQEALAYINKKSWALSRIVNDLLDLSRIELGREIPIEKEPCDLNELLREIEIFGRNLTQKHRFVLELPDQPLRVTVDRGKMEQALENIVSNAIKYSPEGGSITIRALGETDGALIEIRDQGIGMTSEQTLRVFERFYRADTSTTAVEGTGLGMSIVKHVVEGHGGKVWVKSRRGEGTQVYVKLPWNREDGGKG
ncbi:Cache 3/Cache 2 fusion domain-containing protein [Geoalkalibacter halelectricus]|uniref:histidine kinase n=1 Tax=Geoalkalibacter halelectricus TaxID=2847045 RepID=A0ABY5ZPZ6_9BACT|nr:Cache 3/Cache 2 fusion domain-containing protein [Geoalkalibacter halelectricus]MDO3377000.1 Cache 3/Cache 2 fusion domain-containing protein [Geoalkalibacter halelectricus]UWZ81222.1 Cache 3/Cache 2 fusion domain-containing protein [Geoalkalibacter halelectricus]